MLLKLMTVLGLGVLELWGAIPVGFALGLHPVLTALVAAGGALLGVLLVLAVGEGVRAKLGRRREGRGEEGRHARIRRIWLRWGVVGLGLLAPLLTGAALGTALGLSLGAPAPRLLLWMSTGILLWSALLTALGWLGLAGLGAGL